MGLLKPSDYPLELPFSERFFTGFQMFNLNCPFDAGRLGTSLLRGCDVVQG